MKNKSIIMTFILTAITCCLMTSCEKKAQWSDFTFVNSTANYGLQIYWYDEPIFSDQVRLAPGSTYEHSAFKSQNDLDHAVAIKIAYYKKIDNTHCEDTPDHYYTKTQWFEYGYDYEIIVKDQNFTIKETMK